MFHKAFKKSPNLQLVDLKICKKPFKVGSVESVLV